MYKVRAINFGWYRRRHGILLENLPPLKKKLLLESDHMKWLNSDAQAFEIIFKIEDINDHEKSLRKIFWNPFRNNFGTLKDIENDSNSIDWSCAICNTHIRSMMFFKKAENFICNKCKEVHNSKNKVIDSRIIESSNAFVKHCKKLLKKEQLEFINYTKKSAKI